MVEEAKKHSLKKIDHLVTDLDSADQRDEYLNTVYQLFDLYGLGHACITSDMANSEKLTPVWRAIPNEVGSACGKLTDNGRHPAIELARSRYFPFNLFEFRDNFSDDKEAKALFEAFEDNQIFHAYGLPVHSNRQELFAFVVGRVSEPIGTPELLSLQTICSNAVNHVLDLDRQPSKTKKLDQTQTQFLILTAQGVTVSEISRILQLSEVSIEVLKQVVIAKLGASSLPHAIITALVDGEIGISDCVK